MNYLKWAKWAVVDLLIMAILLLSGAYSYTVAYASSYTKTFTISAYYSPLPCQNRYTTGSYEGDIRLNGRGTNGADGTEVYPGMIAAPKTFQFGTKMYIPGVGTVAVHDRGGAIKPSNGEDGVYDRLDIWMGYGDIGLRRALNWGKRNVDVIVYGIDNSIAEQIFLESFSQSEAIPNDCVVANSDITLASQSIVSVPDTNFIPEPKSATTDSLSRTLELGDSGNDVSFLQSELKKLNLFRINSTGYYGEVTEHAVFKFQQSQALVGDEDSLGAGIFGPKTRDRLNEIIATREYTTILIAEASSVNDSSDEIIDNQIETAGIRITSELGFGESHPEVSELQIFLKDHGYFEGALITEYYGPITYQAVLNFQIANDIVSSEDDLGAGRVGPSTLTLINNLS